MPLYNWSTSTGTTNGASDSNINFAEGQSPGSVNDSARNLMAMVARWSGDISGAIVTGGTSTAYTLTSLSVFDTLAHMNGQMIGFVANATSTNAVGVDVTLNVDSLGAKNVRMVPGVALPTGTLISGTPYLAVYNNADGAFYLQNMLNPYVIPLAAGMDYWGSSTPNTSFAFPTGQAISRTTYATLFSLLGTTYGVGDGSTTFNLPDKTGRISAMKEAAGTRLTATYFGGNSANLGAVGGSESHILTTPEMPSHTHTDSGHTHGGVQPSGGSTNSSGTGGSGIFWVATTGSTASGTANITNTGGGGAHAIVQPTIVCNYIIRII